MSASGIIGRKQPISMGEWLAYASETSALVRPADREVYNPFRRATEVRTAPVGEYLVMDNGAEVGTIEPSPEFDEGGELDVYARPESYEHVRSVAETIARSLGAQLEWLNDVDPQG